MPFPPVKLKPGPKVLAAALKLAGFSETSYYPAVTDACGVHWAKPSGLQIALAIIGGESSGHAWCWNDNKDGSTDYGVLEINDKSHPQWFGAQKSPTQLSVWNYAQNAQMAYAIHAADNFGWSAWNAYTGGGYKALRYAGKSWMDWAQYGINQMLAAVAAGETLAKVASTDNDPLEYWV